MSQIMIEGKLVTSPEEFQKFISEGMKKRPVLVSRLIPINTLAKRLEEYAAMWKAELPLLGLEQNINLKQVVLDMCDILELGDDDCKMILGQLNSEND